MTDLIARLRCLNPVGDSFQCICKVTNEAADRIEAQEKTIVRMHDSYDLLMNTTVELRAEVERLKSRIVDSGVELQALAAGAAPQQAEPVQSVPKGWKLVPIEATPEMIEAGAAHHYGSSIRQNRLDAESSWDAMLAAIKQAEPVCGYDDTTGNCTRTNCCKQAEPKEQT